MSETTEPRTAAGRALLRYSMGLPTAFITPTWLEGILAIEAEAREQAALRVERFARQMTAGPGVDSIDAEIGSMLQEAVRLIRETTP